MARESRLLATQRFTLGSVPTHFGCGAIDQLPAVLTSLGHNRAFLVTDSGLVAANITTVVEHILNDAGISTAVFQDVHPNPSTHNLDLGAGAVRAFGPAAVVALGGGSVLDAAKGLAIMATNDGPARAFDYRNEPTRPGASLIAVPTTSGTGAETNGFGVIEDPEVGRKMYVGHASVVPRAVILDPNLTTGLPPPQTAATGMDVMTHALESLSSRRTNPYAEGINRHVVSMVSRYLPRAFADGQDLEARAQMLLAAHMAGLAFATTGLGLAHALAHALSARSGAAHGVVLAILLPHVLTFNLPVCAEAYAGIARSLGVSDDAADKAAKARASIDAVRRLSLGMGMPHSLGEIGSSENLIPVLVEDALVDEVMLNTPRVPSGDELRAILQAAI